MKPMEKQTNWRKTEQRWIGGENAQIRAGTVQLRTEEVYAALQYAASFHCLVEEWQDCEEL